MFESIKTHYPIFFVGGNVKASIAATNSGLAKWGWYGRVLSTAKIYGYKLHEIQQINIYEFLDLAAYEITEKNFENKYIEYNR